MVGAFGMMYPQAMRSARGQMPMRRMGSPGAPVVSAQDAYNRMMPGQPVQVSPAGGALRQYVMQQATPAAQPRGVSPLMLAMMRRGR